MNVALVNATSGKRDRAIDAMCQSIGQLGERRERVRARTRSLKAAEFSLDRGCGAIASADQAR